MMADEFLNPNVFVTPDYLMVYPLGRCPKGSEADNAGGGSSGSGEFNPFDYLNELDQIIESWMNKEYSFDNENLKEKLKGIIKELKETKNELVAVNGKIQAMVSNNDVAITTDDEALAQAIQKINAKFGEIGASIDTLRQTYASENSAISQKFEQLKASVPSAGALATEITKNVETKIAQAVDGKTSSISGDLTRLKTRVGGHDVTITDAKAIATSAKEYAARVKSVVTDGRGRVTGWQYADGTNKTSTFEVMADNFRISNSQKSFVPFEIVGNEIRLGANVKFSQTEQTDTIIEIERYENKTSSMRHERINSASGARNAVVFTVDQSGNSKIQFLGTDASGVFYGSFQLPPYSAAVVMYLNQNKVRVR